MWTLTRGVDRVGRITAIALHLGHDRKTIRAYLKGGRVAGQRVSSEPDPFEPFAAYCAQRLKDDPSLLGSARLASAALEPSAFSGVGFAQLNPPGAAGVLSVDETSQAQAMSRVDFVA